MRKYEEKGCSLAKDNMTSTEIENKKIEYHINEHTILLDKTLVDRYEKYVCPISEDFLLIQIKTANFYKKKNDAVISAEISLDMEYELSGYKE